MPDFSDIIKSLPPLRDVIAQYDLRAKKSLGQNFLLDQNITDKIVQQSGALDGVNVFEIGPGPGGLTRSLLKSEAAKVIAIEFDERAVAALQDLKNAAHGRLEIVQQDALEFDIVQHEKVPRVIVANLPYNIATPLLIGWLHHIWRDNSAINSMSLMFQKEVAQKIVAPVGTKNYGRLSVLAQWLCDVKIVYHLPSSAFTPPPKVSSAVVRFIPMVSRSDHADFSIIETLTQKAFGQRRKMIRSSLKDYAAFFEECGLDETARAENLSPADYVALAQKIRAG